MTDGEDKPQWFVMRDLKRPNALRPAYIDLADKGFEVFTPLRNVLKDNRGRSIRTTAPFIPDLLFVRSTRPALDREVAATPTLQYRFVRGKAANTPLTVRDEDMDRFVKAVRTVDNPNYYTPEEITPTMLRRHISIVGGPLDGYEGILVTVRGSRTKKILVDIPGIIAAAFEVDAKYIRLL